MSTRHLPVRPNLDQLKHQARDLLNAFKQREPDAVTDFHTWLRRDADPAKARLTEAQHVLARSYGLASWPRLVLACRMTDAICRDNADTVRWLVTTYPQLLHEDARGVKGNWGPPMSYAANLGRSRIVDMLRGLGAEDVQFAFERACLQGQLETARLLVSMGARPVPGSVMGPCETLNAEGLAFLLEQGADLADGDGNHLAPLSYVLETYSRNPAGKHQCLDLLERHGVALPDTPPMALHRGRIDLLQAHLQRDPQLLSRRFAHEEIFPPALGCSADPALALCGTPLGGTTLLHMSIEYDEMELLRWLLANGADVNARAAVDGDGFGGHTPLFSAVVVQPIRLRQTDEVARLLLDRGADPGVRASLRKRLVGADDETMHEYRDVTALAWGERFHDPSFVSRPVLRLIAERGGRG